MKDYSNIISKMTSSPWMITPQALKMILELMDAHMSGKMTREDIQVRLQGTNQQNGDSRTRNHRGIGVLSISGPIFPKANLMTEMSGATSVEQFRADFRTMLADDGVSSILLDVDSPGGHSDQIAEMAQEIFEARGIKPIFSIANTAANSAAYYLASQAERMYATPSGQLGSIGTYLVHTDETTKNLSEGVKDTVISAGRFKAVGLEPLTHEGKSYLQDFVNDTNEDFVAAVARGRGTETDDVRSNYGEGGVLTASQALPKGMIDGIATFDEVIQSMVSDGRVAIGQVPLSVAARGTVDSTTGSSVIVTNTTSGNYQIKQADIDKEHAEPGTGLGGEPEPREPPETGDKAIEGGWRRDPPPIAYEEVEEMNRELLVALAGRLGVEFNDETSDEDLANLVTTKVDAIIVPIAAATQSAEKQQEFAQLFPEKAALLARLEQRDREAEAHMFAETFNSFEDEPKRGFSGVVRTKIEDCHMKIAERRMTHEDLKDLLVSATAKESTVEYGESGSARSSETLVVRAGASTQEVRQQVGDLVKTAMTEDSMSRDAAIAHVQAQNPELWNAYVNS